MNRGVETSVVGSSPNISRLAAAWIHLFTENSNKDKLFNKVDIILWLSCKLRKYCVLCGNSAPTDPSLQQTIIIYLFIYLTTWRLFAV